jgi:hypothetical protein
VGSIEYPAPSSRSYLLGDGVACEDLPGTFLTKVDSPKFRRRRGWGARKLWAMTEMIGKAEGKKSWHAGHQIH